MNKQDIINLIKRDKWMMDVLRAARSLNLPDWMIGAGFVRNKVWEYLHDNEGKEGKLNDVDLIYFDANNLTEQQDVEYTRQIKKVMDIEWEIVNQARAHLFRNRDKQYKDSEEALSEWVETATCVAVRLEDDDSITLFTPHGIDDLVNMVVKLTSTRDLDTVLLMQRVESKDWLKKWPKLVIE